MRFFKIETSVPDRDPARVFDILADFPRYPTYSSAVRSVVLREDSGYGTVSEWEVDFRGGILRWVETDAFDPAAGRIEFRQLSGDIDVFTGYWQVEPGQDGCVVEFGCWFDLGIPTLDEVLDPIAEEALHDNIVSIMAGLFGAGTRTVSAVGVQTTPAELPVFPLLTR